MLFGLGVLAFFGLLAEGAMADWSAVYLRDTLETTPALGTALAAVATIGYLGLLAGPPLIGVTAHVTSLPVALGLVSAFCAAIGVGGRALVPAVIPTRTPS